MIKAISGVQTQSKYNRYKLIRDSGYVAIGAGTLCGVTGFRKVRFPFKPRVHKYCAYIAAISSFLHLGAIKNWDKKLLG